MTMQRTPSRPARVGAFRVRLLGDRIFNLTTLLLTLVGLSVLVGLAIALVVDSSPSIRAFGWGFVVGTDWDPVNERFGALPFIYGTLVSSTLALTIAVPLSLGVALCLSEMAPTWLSRRLGFMVELLAAIPSVVYGLWAIFVLGPWLRDHVEPALGAHAGLYAAIPGAARLGEHAVRGRDARDHGGAVHRRGLHRRFRAVPQTQREAALALGATRWEMVRMAVLPYGLSGVIGAIMLGLGRALGETIAVAMVIGNSPQISASLFAPSATLASVIANEFAEATSVAVPVVAGRAGPGAAGGRARAQCRGASAGAGRDATPVRGRPDDGQTNHRRRAAPCGARPRAT